MALQLYTIRCFTECTSVEYHNVNNLDKFHKFITGKFPDITHYNVNDKKSKDFIKQIRIRNKPSENHRWEKDSYSWHKCTKCSLYRYTAAAGKFGLEWAALILVGLYVFSNR